MREEEIVFHTALSREEIITTLKEQFEPDHGREQEIMIYYGNLTSIFLDGNHLIDVVSMYQWLSMVTLVAFAPQLSQNIPQGQERKEVILDRMRHINDHRDLLTEDDISWINSYHALFSTIIDRIGTNEAFTKAFIQYTEIQLQEGEDEEYVAV